MRTLKPRVPYDLETRSKYLELPFPISEYHQRVENTRRLMRKHGLEALVAFGDQNDLSHLTYLANFEPLIGRGAVIVTHDSITLVTDSAFHGEPMHSLIWRTWIEDVRVTGFSFASFLSEVKRVLSDVKGRVSVVGSYSFPTELLGLNVIDAERPFLELKSRKSTNELKVMREASRITSVGMRAAVEAIKVGVRETEVVGLACRTMYEEGASRLAFQPIVVAGPRAGTKHDYPTKRKIIDGDMVYIDLGAISNGYFSDMSRTVLVGKGGKLERNALDSILEIYDELLKQIRPGVRAANVAVSGKNLAESKGWSSDFWASGHGLGTGFSEIPAFSTASSDTFETGMVFAYEPMIVKLGLGTAVVEDTVEVADSGVRLLTEYERKTW
jgi:Xaa-Pro aminopeptidase